MAKKSRSSGKGAGVKPAKKARVKKSVAKKPRKAAPVSVAEMASE